MALTATAVIEWVELGSVYLIAKFPVTVEQYQAFIDAGGYRERGLWSERGWRWREETGFTVPAYWGQGGYDRPRLPVTGVSFWEAEAFARFADARLPSEAEWYLACTNQGTTRYPWGDEADDAGPRRANLNFFGALDEPGRREVDSFPEGRSRAGVWDLLGNVSEWCLPGERRALDPGQAFGVLRGGCAWHTAVAVDATFRDEVALNTRDNQTGIRLVRPLGREDRPVRSMAAQPAPPAERPRSRPIQRPTRPFRQEGIPQDLSAWRLELTGEVERPLVLTLDELRQSFPRTVARGMFVCVCRWGQLNAFAGVALRDLMARARPTRDPDGLYLFQRSVAGPEGVAYEASISLGEALAHDALVAYEMDGHELSRELGWPLRLVDFHLYGYKTVKCLGELRVTGEFRPGWWETERQYDPHGAVRPGTITMVGDRPSARRIDGIGRVELSAEETAALAEVSRPAAAGGNP